MHDRPEHPVADLTFEVDGHGTLRQAGVPELEVNADLYDGPAPDSLRCAQDVARLLQDCPELTERLTALVEQERSEVQDVLESLPAHGPRRAALLLHQQALHDALDDLDPWVQALTPLRLQAIRETVSAWLHEGIDWCSREVPIYSGSQGRALAYFESLPLSSLQDLGVSLVYGDHPGSSYYAAELTAQREQANAAARALGLSIRFVGVGDMTPQPAPSPVRSSPALLGASEDEGLGFKARFGVRADRLAEPGEDRPWPLPPPALRHLHQGALLHSAWSRILQSIRDPVQEVLDAQGNRHLQLNGATVYRVAPDGQWSGRLWTGNATLQPVLQDCPGAALTLDGTPWRWAWLDCWRRGIGFELRAVLQDQGVPLIEVEIERYLDWAFGLFKRRIQRDCDLRAMRLRIAQALDLDPLALSVARQLCLTERRPRASMALYNRVLCNLAAHRKLQTDAPRLHLTYALLCHAPDDAVGPEPPDDEPLQRLQRRVKAHGLSRRLWRTLLLSGSRLWRPMERFYSCCDPIAAWDYLSLLDVLDWPGEPDPAFTQLLLAQYGSAHCRRRTYAHRVLGKERVLRAIVRHDVRLHGAEHAAMRSELPLVLNWLCRDTVLGVQTAARIPPWTTLLRRGRAFDARQRRGALKAHARWACPALQDAQDTELELVLLSSAPALHEEGDVMRHCAGHYAADCAGGRALVGSVRERRGGKRIATVLWERTASGWSMSDVVGFANGPAPPRARTLLARVQLLPGSP